MTETAIVLAIEDGIATLRLNRPDRRNAIDDATRGLMIEALESAAADPAVRALVITGTGTAFCAGGDVRGMQQRLSAPPGEVAFNGWRRQGRTHRAVALLHNFPKPTIAAVNGAAAGLGCDVALACDFVMAAESAHFTMSFVAPRPDPRWRRHVLPAAPRRPGARQGTGLQRPPRRRGGGAGDQHDRARGARRRPRRRRDGLGEGTVGRIAGRAGAGQIRARPLARDELRGRAGRRRQGAGDLLHDRRAPRLRSPPSSRSRSDERAAPPAAPAQRRGDRRLRRSRRRRPAARSAICSATASTARSGRSIRAWRRSAACAAFPTSPACPSAPDVAHRAGRAGARGGGGARSCRARLPARRSCWPAAMPRAAATACRASRRCATRPAACGCSGRTRSAW